VVPPSTPKRACSGSAQCRPARTAMPVAIEEGGEVVRMHVVQREGEDAAAILRPADQGQALDAAQHGHGVVHQRALMRLDGGMPMLVT
jgi:hypothetical protein